MKYNKQCVLMIQYFISLNINILFDQVWFIKVSPGLCEIRVELWHCSFFSGFCSSVWTWFQLGRFKSPTVSAEGGGNYQQVGMVWDFTWLPTWKVSTYGNSWGIQRAIVVQDQALGLTGKLIIGGSMLKICLEM